MHHGNNRIKQEQMEQIVGPTTQARSKTIQPTFKSLVCDKLVQTGSLEVKVIKEGQ